METFAVVVETEDDTLHLHNVTSWTVGEDEILHVLSGDDFVASFISWTSIVKKMHVTVSE